jgi:hypothetical protein
MCCSSSLSAAAAAAVRLVLYVPSAANLTRGGFFYRRPDGSYDTIISAQHILKSVADSHQQQLAGLPVRLEATQQLLDGVKVMAAAADRGSSGSREASRRGKGSPDKDAVVVVGGRGGLTVLDLVKAGLSTDEDVSGGCM